MADTRYDFLKDSFFNIYTPVETPKVELNLPLFDSPIDISSWASGISSTGIPIAKSKEQEETPQQTRYTMVVNNTEEAPIQQVHVNKETKNMNLDISFEDLLKEEGVHAIITSGYRPGAIAASGKPSHHATKNGAFDVVPTNGNFEDLRKEIYGNPRIVAWLKNKGWGILEETNPEIKRKTHATGDHWHFGPDKKAVEQFNSNLA